MAVTKAVKLHVGVVETQPQYEEPLFAAYERAGKPGPAARWIKPLVKRDYPWVLRRPRWVESEGDWPFSNAKPMLYVSQVFLRENPVAREYLTWDTMLYLFIGCDNGLSEVKIYEQHTGEQTAEDHYKTEELIGEYLNNPNDADVIKKCVEHRDKYLHQFLLEQQNISADALKLLAAKSYNKSIRNDAAKRLKGM